MTEQRPQPLDQSHLFTELLEVHNLDHGNDYIRIDTINGIEYYTPNDEDWGSIVAVDRTNKLAAFTGFHEMDDMSYPDSDYAIVLDEEDGTLKCRFLTE